jgi:hypothetical protein
LAQPEGKGKIKLFKKKRKKKKENSFTTQESVNELGTFAFPNTLHSSSDS